MALDGLRDRHTVCAAAWQIIVIDGFQRWV
jgi:hypothetical protein